MTIIKETLIQVLNIRFIAEIKDADYTVTQLHGGTVGEVYLVEGTTTEIDGTGKPYRLVLKIQRKWERYGDPGSWRREYDLYQSGLENEFTGTFRWPKCYASFMNEEENEYQLWMEYIEGVSGLDLTLAMYEKASYELGNFQGKLYTEQPYCLKSVSNLSHVDFMKNFYLHYRSWNVVYDYIRSKKCKLPKHICEMLIHFDESFDGVCKKLEQLPIVLCHRDFWVANIFTTKNQIVLLDWDTAGYGFLGEDIASLIADESNITLMPELYQKCTAAYYSGFSQHADISGITDNCIYEMILMMFGYRLVEGYLEACDADDPEDAEKNQAEILETLQKIYEMGQSRKNEETLTHIYFVRHCQSKTGWKKSDSIRPLTECGKTDTAIVTLTLRDIYFDYCICSPYIRSMETIKECALNQGLIIHTDARFGERISGPDNNEQARRMRWVDKDWHEEGGESMNAVQKRNIEGLEEVLEAHAGETILFGTHGTALSSILSYYDEKFGYPEFHRLINWMPYVVHAVFDGTHMVSHEDLLIVNRGY